MFRYNVPILGVDSSTPGSRGCKFMAMCGDVPIYFANVFKDDDINKMEFYMSRSISKNGKKTMFANPLTSPYSDQTFAFAFEAPNKEYKLVDVLQNITASAFHIEPGKLTIFGQENSSLYAFPGFTATFYNAREDKIARYAIAYDEGYDEFRIFDNFTKKGLHQKNIDFIETTTRTPYISVGNGRGKYFTPTLIRPGTTVYLNSEDPMSSDEEVPVFQQIGDHLRRMVPSTTHIEIVSPNDLYDEVMNNSVNGNAIFLGYKKKLTKQCRTALNELHQRKMLIESLTEEDGWIESVAMCNFEEASEG